MTVKIGDYYMDIGEFTEALSDLLGSGIIEIDHINDDYRITVHLDVDEKEVN